MLDLSERERLILDVAAGHILHHGYDKTTMGDVAREAGLSRGLVYVHFKSKEALLEALIERETRKYIALWLEHIESDPRGGSIGSTYRGVLKALRDTPFLAAIVSRDREIFGKYLRQPGNVFGSMNQPEMMRGFLRIMQESGAVRADVNIEAMAYVIDALSAAIIEPRGHDAPHRDALLETIGEMLDRMLMPEGGGNLAAGKAILREMAQSIQRQVGNGRRGDME